MLLPGLNSCWSHANPFLRELQTSKENGPESRKSAEHRCVSGLLISEAKYPRQAAYYKKEGLILAHDFKVSVDACCFQPVSADYHGRSM
jgi:hypothetical protein